MLVFIADQNEFLQHNLFSLVMNFKYSVKYLLQTPNTPHQLFTFWKEAEGDLPLSPGIGKGCKQTGALCRLLFHLNNNVLKV